MLSSVFLFDPFSLWEPKISIIVLSPRPAGNLILTGSEFFPLISLTIDSTPPSRRIIIFAIFILFNRIVSGDGTPFKY